MRTRLLIVSVIAWTALPVAAQAKIVDPGRVVVSSLGTNARILAMNPDGSNQVTVFDIPPDWAVGGLDVTDDGSMVAMTFLPGNKGHVYVASADGSGFRRLTSGGDDYDPAFAPGGQRLVFTRSERGRSYLYRIDSDGTDLRRLTSPGEPDAEFASWSPDGQHIVFIDRSGRRERLIVADRRVRTFDVIYRATSDEPMFTTAWSPDGSTIVFGVYDDSYLNADLWAIGPDGSGLTPLTDTPVAEVSPSFSPDGSQIAVSAQNELQGTYQLLVMDANGGNPDVIGTAGKDVFHVAWGGTPT